MEEKIDFESEYYRLRYALYDALETAEYVPGLSVGEKDTYVSSKPIREALALIHQEKPLGQQEPYDETLDLLFSQNIN